MKKLAIVLVLSLFGIQAIIAQESGKACCKKKSVEKEKLSVNLKGSGLVFDFEFTSGKKHNYPTFAIWIEDMQGNFVQELFVTQAFGRGVFKYGTQSNGKWVEGPRRYQATLPYFLHKRGVALKLSDIVPSEKNPVADAYTGATPKSDFFLTTRSDSKSSEKFRVLIEINQAWDVNEYWFTNKFEGDSDYKASCQPSLIYAVTIDPADKMEEYVFNPIGHGHYSGKDGKLYTDLSTLTTALQIFSRISMKIE